MMWSSVLNWLNGRKQPRVVTVNVAIAYDGGELARATGGAGKLDADELRQFEERMASEAQRLFRHEFGVRCETTADGATDEVDAEYANEQTPAAATAEAD